jgi:hypothetical protein
MSAGVLAIILIGVIALAALVWWFFGRDAPVHSETDQEWTALRLTTVETVQ